MIFELNNIERSLLQIKVKNLIKAKSFIDKILSTLFIILEPSTRHYNAKEFVPLQNI